jgi:hypothetical protein
MPLVRVSEQTLKLIRKIKGFLLQQYGLEKSDEDAVNQSAKCFIEKHDIKIDEKS